MGNKKMKPYITFSANKMLEDCQLTGKTLTDFKRRQMKNCDGRAIRFVGKAHRVTGADGHDYTSFPAWEIRGL